VLLENFYVVGVGERAVEGVVALLEGDPLLAAQSTPQAVEGVVEGATKLCRSR
jgi:hypothetical protein